VTIGRVSYAMRSGVAHCSAWLSILALLVTRITGICLQWCVRGNHSSDPAVIKTHTKTLAGTTRGELEYKLISKPHFPDKLSVKNLANSPARMLRIDYSRSYFEVFWRPVLHLISPSTRPIRLNDFGQPPGPASEDPVLFPWDGWLTSAEPFSPPFFISSIMR